MNVGFQSGMTPMVFLTGRKLFAKGDFSTSLEMTGKHGTDGIPYRQETILLAHQLTSPLPFSQRVRPAGLCFCLLQW